MLLIYDKEVLYIINRIPSSPQFRNGRMLFGVERKSERTYIVFIPKSRRMAASQNFDDQGYRCMQHEFHWEFKHILIF